MKVGDLLYRYVDYKSLDDTDITCVSFRVREITPKGYSIIRWDNKDRETYYVLHGDRKFAYETPGRALKSFIARKERQIEILAGQLKDSKRALSLAKEVEKTQ